MSPERYDDHTPLVMGEVEEEIDRLKELEHRLQNVFKPVIDYPLPEKLERQYTPK